MLKTRPLLTVLLLLAFASCRACEDDVEPERVVAKGTPETGDTESASARLSRRQIDRTKHYPKDEEGSVNCGSDLDCFVLQAENCGRATLENHYTLADYGVEQRVHTRFRIRGPEASQCKVTSELVSLDVTLHPAMVDALRKQGKPEEMIQDIRNKGIESLQRNNPKRRECWFTSEQILHAALDLAEGKPNPTRWRLACREVTAPPESESALAAPGTAPAAAPGALAAPGAPAAPPPPPTPAAPAPAAPAAARPK